MLVTLGLSNLVVGLMVALFLFVCIILILTVLIQRPQGGGLSGAFGSNAGSGQTAFGAKTGDALTIATIGMFVIYIVAATGLNYAVRPPAPGSGTPTATDPAAPANPAETPVGATPATTTPEGTPPGPEGAAPTTITIPPATAPATGTEPAPAPAPTGTAPAPVPSEPTPAPAPAAPGSTPPAPAPGGGGN
jgi:preprotein translocase subunit SecG